MKLLMEQWKQFVEAAETEKQKRFMHAVEDCKEDGDCPSDEIEKAADSMTMKQVKDYTDKPVKEELDSHEDKTGDEVATTHQAELDAATKLSPVDEKKKKKDDRCTRIAKRKYDTWPSAYASGAVVQCRKGKIWKGVKENEELEEKTDYSKEKDSGLHGWFSRQGGKGKSSGWVDCNTCRKDKKTGRKKCKSCGRGEGEKRSKYPSCRPTPSACGTKGKGKKWGKKKESINLTEEQVNNIVEDIVVAVGAMRSMSEGLRYHVENNIPLSDSIYRLGSEQYFNMYSEARKLANEGKYQFNEEDTAFLQESDLGEYAMFEGEMVPLDFPMYIMTEEEHELAEKKKKEKGPIGKPMKNSGGGKKYKVYVKSKKTGNVKTLTYGDSKGGLKGNWNDPDARSSFAARHDCENKKDRTKAGYWACRAHKDFGTNVPGRFW